MLLQITRPMAGQTLYIDALGRMPGVRCEACLLDDANQVVKAPMRWSLHIVENIWPAACPSAKVGRQVVSAQGTSVGAGLWTPAFNMVIGGEATLQVSAEHNAKVFQAMVNFKVRGNNPSPDAVIERLGGERSPLSFMAHYLSGLKQFDCLGMPGLGKRGEVGIMQLCDPAAQPQHRWSWTHNVEAGKALMQRMQGNAKAYLDQHRIDGVYVNDQSLSDAGVLLREMLQRYLGEVYWQWDESSQQWRANPPDAVVDTLLQPKSENGQP